MSEITTFYDVQRLGTAYMRGSTEVYFISDVEREQAKTQAILEHLRGEPFYQDLAIKTFEALGLTMNDPTVTTLQPLDPAGQAVMADLRLNGVGYQMAKPAPPDHGTYPGFLEATEAETHRAIFTDRISCVPCGQAGCVLCDGKGWYEE